MPRRAARVCWPVVLLLIVGCGSPPSQQGTAAGEEGQLKEAFAAYQRALKDKDADKLWDLLSTEARGDADRSAKRLRDDYAKGDAKAKLAKGVGVSADQVANLTGKDYLKTPRFAGTHPQDEIPTSKFESASIQGDKATVNYVEDDGDKQKLPFVREGGRWKVSAAVE